jgi:FkbM family methyltransferase
MKYSIVKFLKYFHLIEISTKLFIWFYNFIYAIYPKRLNPIQFKKGDLVFDVGANIGLKTQEYLNKGLKVIAIEPQSSLIELLNSKFKNNPNVITEQCGISNQNAVMKISICSTTLDQATFVLDRKEKVLTDRGYDFVFDKVEEVPVFTLDYMISKHGLPAYIKIDVETYEKEVIQGLSQSVKYLSFEYANTYPDITINILEMLAKLGFKEFTFGVSEWMPWPWQKWYNLEHFSEIIKSKASKSPIGAGDIYAKN